MKKILTHIEMSRKGGKAGTGAAKARTSKQARKAALARWHKLEAKQMKHLPNSTLGCVARVSPIILAAALLCGCREKERIIDPANIPTGAQHLVLQEATNGFTAVLGGYWGKPMTSRVYITAVGINSGAFVTNSEYNFFVGDKAGLTMTNSSNNIFMFNPCLADCNNISIGDRAGTWSENHNCIAIGNNARPTNSYELVIRFRSGKEFRMALPTNDPVALDWFVK